MARRARTYSDGERGRLLEELEESGLSVAAFARERRISAWTIYSWRRQKRERQVQKEDGSAPFIQVKVAPSGSFPAPLEVELNDGVRVRVPSDFDEHVLRRLLGVLASC